MKENYLKIIFVIDESGSMSGSESDVTGGFNSYVEKQRNENTGKVTVSLYKFNSDVSCVISNKPISEIKNLTSEDYTPNSFTALYDAIGHAIKDSDNEVSSTSEKKRPDCVMMVIITDGQENASKVYTSEAIRTMIASHENLLNWKFIYLGTGLSDFIDADLIGMKYRASSRKDNLKSKFDNVAESTIRYRRMDSSNDLNENIKVLMNILEDKK